jgi:sugar lactone lactonase YvrE
LGAVAFPARNYADFLIVICPEANFLCGFSFHISLVRFQNMQKVPIGKWSAFIRCFITALSLTGALLAQSTNIPYSFSVLAGTPGSAGSLNGVTGNGPVALLNSPEGIAVDSSGNAYVTDLQNDCIRKISTSGEVTTVAGSQGAPGFYVPFSIGDSIAVDGSGTIFFTDQTHALVCKITTNGVESTVAGMAGRPVYVDGTGTAAGFQDPEGIAVDANDNLYVAESTTGVIRKITPAGVVTTLAGDFNVRGGSADGTGLNAQFSSPTSVTVDNIGNVYVADERNETIRKISPLGVVSTLAGTAGNSGSANGTGPAAQFNLPSSVSVDEEGNVYVCDYGDSIIRKVTAGGVVTTLAGTPNRTGSADGIGPAAEFYFPVEVAVDSSGNVFVTNRGDNTVRKISPTGSVGTVAGFPGQLGSVDGGGPHARFNVPNGVAVDAYGDVFVTDTFNSTIREIPVGSPVTCLAGQTGVEGSADGVGGSALFTSPSGLAIDATGNLYVSDYGTDTIRKVTPSGVVTTLAGTAGISGSADGTGAAAKFNRPGGVGVDGAGNVYVADSANNTIRKISSSGVVSTLAGSAGSFGTADGMGSSARFNQPYGIAIDGSGNIYVGDINNNTIRKVTAAGMVTTIIGNAGVAGSADGMGTKALLNQPGGLAFDSYGNLIIADTGNNTIRLAAPSGLVNTIAGTAGVTGSANGIGAAAGFSTPIGVAVDSSDNIYVSDSNNDTIRIGSPFLAPALTSQPISQTLSLGSTVVFSVAAVGSPLPSYQWSLDGAPIVGATSSSLTINDATFANAGSYTCTITNPSGSVTSNAATLTLVTTPNPGRLINISCRAQVSAGANLMIAGFVVGGTGTSGNQAVLVRGSGPVLGAAPFSLQGVLQDPMLTLANVSDNPSIVITTDTGWGGAAVIANTAAAVGAFSWGVRATADSAVLESLPAGNYTAEIAGADGDSGIALVEVFDATPNGSYTPTASRLINLSARAYVGTGSNTVFAGFVIGGSTAKTVLIRASGPALALFPFNLTGTLSDPQLVLTNVGITPNVVLAANTAWNGNPGIAAAAAAVGAFPWGTSSRDSAILITLPPGNYTAGVTGASGDTGIALVEVYEVQ